MTCRSVEDLNALLYQKCLLNVKEAAERFEIAYCERYGKGGGARENVEDGAFR